MVLEENFSSADTKQVPTCIMQNVCRAIASSYHLLLLYTKVYDYNVHSMDILITFVSNETAIY